MHLNYTLWLHICENEFITEKSQNDTPFQLFNMSTRRSPSKHTSSSQICLKRKWCIEEKKEALCLHFFFFLLIISPPPVSLKTHLNMCIISICLAPIPPSIRLPLFFHRMHAYDPRAISSMFHISLYGYVFRLDAIQ